MSDAYVRLCAPANITGLPALTVPVGRDGAGLPIGMQLIGPYGADDLLLRLGEDFEAAQPWAHRWPDLDNTR